MEKNSSAWRSEDANIEAHRRGGTTQVSTSELWVGVRTEWKGVVLYGRCGPYRTANAAVSIRATSQRQPYRAWQRTCVYACKRAKVRLNGEPVVRACDRRRAV